jgi:hypothetical protein
MTPRVLFTALLAALGLSFAVLPVSTGAATFNFAGTTSRSCWEDTEGFTSPPDLQPIALPAGSPPGTHFLRQTDTAIFSTVALNTDGTLTSTSTGTTIRGTTTGRVNGSETACNGTWTFDAATQRLSTTTTCSFTNTVGGSSTGTLDQHTIYRLAGTILVLVEPTTPLVETVNVLTGSGAPFSYQRVCGRSGTLHLVQ